MVNNLPASAEDADSISELGRSPRGGNGNPIQDSCLGVHVQMSLAGCSPWGLKELDSTERPMAND